MEMVINASAEDAQRMLRFDVVPLLVSLLRLPSPSAHHSHFVCHALLELGAPERTSGAFARRLLDAGAMKPLLTCAAAAAPGEEPGLYFKALSLVEDMVSRGDDAALRAEALAAAAAAGAHAVLLDLQARVAGTASEASAATVCTRLLAVIV